MHLHAGIPRKPRKPALKDDDVRLPVCEREAVFPP